MTFHSKIQEGVKMKQITKELRIIKLRKELRKARAEYHSFMRVRQLKDIDSSYDLTAIMLRLELNLVNAINSLNKALKRK